MPFLMENLILKQIFSAYQYIVAVFLNVRFSLSIANPRYTVRWKTVQDIAGMLYFNGEPNQ
jgi:hypothetical protein